MIFRDPEAALKWAYETTDRPIVKGSSVYRMRGPEVCHSASDLLPYDRVAQAGMIKGLCTRVLPQLHMAYVEARYGKGRDPAGMGILRYYLAGTLGSGMHSQRCIDLVIRGYCGEPIGVREIRKIAKCRTQAAMEVRNRGHDALDEIHRKTMDVLWIAMDEAGMIRAAG